MFRENGRTDFAEASSVEDGGKEREFLILDS
jgi:hypothetical protein